MKKINININFEKIFQMLIYVLLLNYIFGIMSKNNLSRYLHPRMTWLIIISLIIITSLIFFPFPKITGNKKNSIFKFKYLIFSIFLFILYLSPDGKDIQQKLINLRGIKISENTNVFENKSRNQVVSKKNSNTISNDKETVKIEQKGKHNLNSKKEPMIQNDQQLIVLKNDISSDKKDSLKEIKINQDEKKEFRIDYEISQSDFIKRIDDIYRYQDKYDYKHVKVKGFVFRTKDFSKEQFVVGRLAIFCCSADASFYGLLCKLDEVESSKLEDNQWLEVEGTVLFTKTDFSEGKKIPIIYVKNYQKVKKPDEEYVYFNSY
jgi:uncharacterized repeat protein (TIGR03943 family)